jgi:outer membrane protein OmpA-like peptidoglycan-associated protein
MIFRIAARTLAVVIPMALMAAAPASAQTPSQPAPAVPYPQAVTNAARSVFKAIPLPPGDSKVDIVIDPLLDGATGIHTVAAADMGRRLAEIARAEFPRLAIVDFTEEALARKPLLLIGSITLLRDAGQVGGRPAAKPYAIWFTVADTEKREVVAKSNARATPEGVNTLPTPSHSDSPTWRKDATTQSYLESCRNIKVGEQLNPTYAAQLTAASVIAKANRAYDAGRTEEALELYRKARTMPGGRQLRVLNGIYASLARLNKAEEANEAFGEIVDYGMENRDLAVKLLFRTGTARFVETTQAGAYPIWLKQIAAKTAAHRSCIEIVGHTSPTGSVAFNDRLSQLRAEYVREQLRSGAYGMDNLMLAKGVGSRENIVGTGRDDATDAIDRRVAFNVANCP